MRAVSLLTIVCAFAMMPMASDAQETREMTLFGNPGFNGAQFTVTGPREHLNLPFIPGSALLKGGGAWQVCTGDSYAGTCRTLDGSTRDLGMRVQSARPLSTAPVTPWRDIIRLSVRDHADRDTANVSDPALYRQVMVCAERNTVRLRRAEVQLGNRRWQRIFLPLVIAPGQCSKAVDLAGNSRRIRAVRFEYEAWTPGWKGASIVVRGLPHVTPQPR